MHRIGPGIPEKAEWRDVASLSVLAMTQNFIITAGLVAGSILCAIYIQNGRVIQERQFTVGDFILFCTYLLQLYGPLNFFGVHYRNIQAALVDMENMLELLNVDQDVKDLAKAPEINIQRGEIEFKDVFFHYQPSIFPQGYETVVGERGLKLSGGEKQRVAIARTLLKNPQIILLDEATSALDTHTERNILRSFEKICANRTTLVVAHRLSTIIHAHQILVLDEGVVKERGTHEELLTSGGIYYTMWTEQQKSREKEESNSKLLNAASWSPVI
ncbi:ABCB6 [Bugula neritina]|uniref:ABCB6 n=1 Tax=Bugula neritina TaxID=10212 RepID=A0A7J7JM53_BUGNE|nr:ABCB6 [Bugula neritina]